MWIAREREKDGHTEARSGRRNGGIERKSEKERSAQTYSVIWDTETQEYKEGRPEIQGKENTRETKVR